MSLKFYCPVCESKTYSRNVYFVEGTDKLVRRRKCTKCGYGFYTIQPQEEILEYQHVYHAKELREHKTVRLVPEQ